MAATGQRIHPAGSRLPTPDTPRPRRGRPRPHTRARRLRCRLRGDASGTRSHEVVAMALEAVARVAHRGAASTDNSGDGAGLLTQIPHRLFYRDAYRLGLHLQPGLPVRRRRLLPAARAAGAGGAVRMIEQVLAEDGIPFLGWRDVPDQPGGARPHGARRRAR